MKSVLISIQPRWCELIASGKKTAEVRKTRPKGETPFKCFIYETKGKSGMPTFIDEDGHISCEGRGEVIGEFVCDYISEIHPNDDGYGVNQYIFDAPIAITFGAALSFDELKQYLGAKPGYSWHISDLVIYDEPKALGEFGLTRPFQSWGYVNETD